MPDERFDILFSGQLIPGQDPAAARDRIARLFKTSAAQVERLFCGRPVVVKKRVDLDTASRYRLAFRQLGALVDIRAASAPAQLKPQRPAQGAKPHMTLLPPNTGSLEEFAPRVTPAALPDISAMGLGNRDRPLDETPPPPPASVDTEDLSLVPGQDWTLEDCQPLPLAQLSPDIDGLELTAPDDTSHIPANPPPLPLPDISAMRIEEPAQSNRDSDSDDQQTSP
jgi:hypothetical protein